MLEGLERDYGEVALREKAQKLREEKQEKLEKLLRRVSQAKDDKHGAEEKQVSHKVDVILRKQD